MKFIMSGDVRWIQSMMLKSRNIFTHVYDENEILSTVKLIYSDFALLFKTLDEKLECLTHNPDYQ